METDKKRTPYCVVLYCEQDVGELVSGSHAQGAEGDCAGCAKLQACD